jgi:hypothetical protein
MDFPRKIIRSKPFIICTAVLVFYTLTGFLIAPWLVRHYVPKIVQEQIKKQALIGEVRINPYLFKAEANDFRMEEADGQPIASFKRLFVDFELKSLLKWAWTFRQVRLEGPHVNAVITKDGTLNLASLAPPSEATSQPPTKEQAPPRLIIEDIAIDGGQIDFTDRRQSEPATISLTPLQLQVNNLSTLRERNPKAKNYGERFVERRKLLNNLCKDADVNFFGFHDIRHTVAKYLNDLQKVNLKKVQQVLRHRRQTTTEIYVEGNYTDTRNAISLLELEKVKKFS